MKFNLKQVLISLALAGVFTTADATPISPDNIASPVDMASFFGGTLVDSAITAVTAATFTGTAYTAVYDSGSGYDFYYQFVNDASSRNADHRITGFDFTGFTTNAFQTADAFGIFAAGTQQSDAVARDEFGVVGFLFPSGLGGGIDPGEASLTQIIRTNATAYQPGTFSIIDGSTATVVAFAPAVPELETYAMMLAGLGLIGFIGKRRLQQSSLHFV